MQRFWLLVIFSGFLAFPFIGKADFDPFSVYEEKEPEKCIDEDIANYESKLTLPDLIQIALCRNPSLARDYMAVKSSAASVGEAKSAYLPSVNFNAGIQYNYNDYKNPPPNASPENIYPYNANIGLSWLLFDFGGRSSRTEMMKAYLESASFNYNAVLHNMVLSINKAYFDLLGAKEVLAANEKSVASYKRSYEESKKRYDIGLAAKSDMLLARTTYEKSRLNVISSQNNIEKYQGTLASLLNLPPYTVFNLETPEEAEATALGMEDDVNKMIATALSLRPELKQALSEGKAAKEKISLTKSDGLPVVSADLSAGYDRRWKEGGGYRLFNNTVGLNLNFPLFTGFADTYKILRAKSDYEQSRLSVTAVKDLIKNEVWSCYQDYKTAVAAYNINQEVLKSAEENERVSVSSYQAGREAILNLLTVQAQLASARQDLAISFYNVLIAKTALYRAVGNF